MSGRTDDTNFRTPILNQSKKDRDSSPALSELSNRDKPWDIHRANAEIIARHYKSAGMDRHSERVTFCSLLLDFRLVPEKDEQSYKLKLAASYFCRTRYCCICQWRRSLKWRAKAMEALPVFVSDFPKFRYLFVTLTLKNCELTELRDTIKKINYAFRKLSRRKVFPGQGWIKSIEVTRGRDGRTAHPHAHILMAVKPSFFSHGYIKRKEWCELWQDCLQVDYKPMLDVRAVKPEKSPASLLSEIIKYQTKESDLIADPKWFAEYVKQMHGTRAVSVGGLFIDYFKKLEQEPEDLIGKDEEEDKDELMHLYFSWRNREKKYRLNN